MVGVEVAPAIGESAVTARGLTHAQAVEYCGVKRRTFDEVWRPRLRAIRQGSCLLFDRHEIDSLFDAFMNDEASHAVSPPATAVAEARPVQRKMMIGMDGPLP